MIFVCPTILFTVISSGTDNLIDEFASVHVQSEPEYSVSVVWFSISSVRYILPAYVTAFQLHPALSELLV